MRSMSSARRVAELLTGNSGGIHEPALGDGEDQRSLLVAQAIHGRILLAAARARFRARGACGRVRSRGHCDRTRPRGKLEASGLEFVERALVLEENNLAIRLAAGLKARPELRHRGIAAE